MWQHVPATYVLSHHHEQLQVAIDAGQRVVTSGIDLGGPGWGTPCALTGEYFVYNCGPYTLSLTPTINTHALEADTLDRLVPSCCTTSEAMQFAAHLGAMSIVCCGVDGADLDGQTCVTGYNIDHTGQAAQTNPHHLRLTQTIIRETAAALRTRGVCVSSHDPFVGYQHEGHIYTGAERLEGRDLITALNTINYQAAAVSA